MKRRYVCLQCMERFNENVIIKIRHIGEKIYFYYTCIVHMFHHDNRFPFKRVTRVTVSEEKSPCKYFVNT